MKILRVLVSLNKVAFFVFGGVLLRLAGMPPFSGFFMKAFRVYLLVDRGFVLLGLFFVVCATLSLGYYINVLFLGMLRGGVRGARKIGYEMSFVYMIFTRFSIFFFPVLVRVIV